MWKQEKEGTLGKVTRNWTNIGENFVKNLFFFFLSLSDMGTDFLTGREFWFGGDYTKKVNSTSDPYVTGIFNCTQNLILASCTQ